MAMNADLWPRRRRATKIPGADFDALTLLEQVEPLALRRQAAGDVASDFGFGATGGCRRGQGDEMQRSGQSPMAAPGRYRQNSPDPVSGHPVWLAA
jgi:hypothetical protein